jgi:cell division septation protein DedD
MSNTHKWHASVRENRVALIIACICIAIISSLSAWPNLIPFRQNKAQAPDVRHASPVKKPTAKPAAKIAAKKRSPAKAVRAAKSQTKKRPAARPEKAPASAKPAFYVQVGAFKQVARAQGLIDQLHQHRWAAIIEARPKQFHAVWAGPFTSRAMAEKLMEQINSKLKIKGFIVQKKGG